MYCTALLLSLFLIAGVTVFGKEAPKASASVVVSKPVKQQETPSSSGPGSASGSVKKDAHVAVDQTISTDKKHPDVADDSTNKKGTKVDADAHATVETDDPKKAGKKEVKENQKKGDAKVSSKGEKEDTKENKNKPPPPAKKENNKKDNKPEVKQQPAKATPTQKSKPTDKKSGKVTPKPQ